MQKLITRYLLLTAIFITFSFLVFVIQSKQSKQKTEIDLFKIPLDIGEWRGKEIPIDKQTKDILETNSVLIREYTNSKDDAISLAIVYYKDSRIAFHLPESCLLGHGSRLLDRESEKIQLLNSQNFYATKLTIKNDMGNNIVLYYFETGNLRSKDYFAFRKQILMNRLKGKGSSGALVRFTINYTKDNFQEKLKILKSFIAELGSVLPKYLI